MMATGIDTSLLEPEAEFAFDRSYSLTIVCVWFPWLTHNIGPALRQKPQIVTFDSTQKLNPPESKGAKLQTEFYPEKM